MAYRKRKGKRNIDNNDSIEIITSEETLRMERFERVRNARAERREEILSAICNIVREIVFRPLGILFHAISFISKIIGGVSAIGMLAGFWYAYKAFHAWKSGMTLSEITEIRSALVFLIFPFIAYSISVIAEKAWAYFEDNI